MTLADPNLTRIIADLDDADNNAAEYYGRKDRSRCVRHCIWDGQDPSGRKLRDRLGYEPFPWEGAHDSKVRLVDLIANRNVRLKKHATLQSRPRVSGVEAGDMAQAAIVSSVMNWLLYTHCLDMLDREIEIAANIQEDCGLVVMAVFWQMTTRTELKRVSMDALQALFAQSRDVQIALLIQAILDPLAEQTAVELLEQMIPGQGTRANVRSLRKQGYFEFENEYIFESLPRWIAMEPWEDIYFPPSADDLQTQPYIYCRELIGEAELRSRGLTDGYDEDWIEQACKHKNVRRRDPSVQISGNPRGTYTDPNDKRIEIWHAYRKESTDSGATLVTETVFHPLVKDVWGMHEIMAFEHGEYPFVAIPRERHTRRLIDARGIGEVLSSEQQTAKQFRDLRLDRAEIAINPPMRVPANRGKLAQLIGPRAEIPERRQGEISPYMVQPEDGGAVGGEMEAKTAANEYAGRNGEGIDTDEVELTKQAMVNNWLIGIKLCQLQTLALAQQYMPDEEVARVTGMMGVTWQADRSAIQGRFDLTVEFDVANLNSDQLGQKLDYITKAIVPLDVTGVIDRAGLVEFIMSALDPRMAQLLVRNPGAAAASEASDEQQALAQLWAGIEPPLGQPGQNAQLRLQVIGQQLQANPEWAQRFQADPVFQKMLQARVQSFQFQIQQHQINPQIGRQGAVPALSQPLPQVLPPTGREAGAPQLGGRMAA